MAETKQEGTKKPLTLNRPGRLELKKTVETGQVRQSFSHGRTKAVTVEVKKKRTFQRGESGRMAEVKDAPVIAEEDLAELEKDAGLSETERAARQRALEIAAQRTDDDGASAEALEALAALDEAAPIEEVAPAEAAAAPTDAVAEAAGEVTEVGGSRRDAAGPRSANQRGRCRAPPRRAAKRTRWRASWLKRKWAARSRSSRAPR